MLLEVHAIISGRVQGVGFRATTRTIARQIGVVGSAKNLPDGTVEIYAQGTQDQLDKFISSINEQFGSRYIRLIETDYFEPDSVKEGFDIQ